MTENNNIENLFKDALSSFEAPVDASLWQGIENAVQPSSGISDLSQPGSVVKSLSFVKIFAAVAAISLVGVITYLSLSPKEIQHPSPIVKSPYPIHNNSGSVSETVTQPIPEKMAPMETKPVSTIHVKSSPEIFPSVVSDPQHTPENAGKGATSSSVNTPGKKWSTPEPSETATLSDEKHNAISETQKELPPPVKTAPGAQGTQTAEEPRLAENQTEQLLVFPGLDKQIFTPNGDGKNDLFETEDGNMQSVYIKIISVSGKMVYLRSQLGGGWNGNLQNGNEAPEGLYIAFINGIGLDGKKYARITRLLLERN